MKNFKHLNHKKTLTILPFIVLLIGFTSMSFEAEPLVSENQNECPNAAFYVSNNNCIAPCEIVFNNSSQDAESYFWDFGDGTISTEANPRHAYTSVGSFTVTLTAFAEGCQATHLIIVETQDN